jgi:hypothetical protein
MVLPEPALERRAVVVVRQVAQDQQFAHGHIMSIPEPAPGISDLQHRSGSAGRRTQHNM